MIASAPWMVEVEQIDQDVLCDALHAEFLKMGSISPQASYAISKVATGQFYSLPSCTLCVNLTYLLGRISYYCL
jgi:hypothetical protein